MVSSGLVLWGPSAYGDRHRGSRPRHAGSELRSHLSEIDTVSRLRRSCRQAGAARSGLQLGELRSEVGGMGPLRVAVVGVGNCASSLVQGVEYYKGADPEAVVP